MALTIKSTDFTDNGVIPSELTCDGKDISPHLSWSDAPQGTQSYVLIMDDPDAPKGTWDHWIVANISVNNTEFARAIATLPKGTIVGNNSWGRADYGGPCPPSGEHRYFFKLYALDTMLNLKSGASRSAIENAMKGHVLASATLMGRYNRSKRVR